MGKTFLLTGYIIVLIRVDTKKRAHHIWLNSDHITHIKVAQATTHQITATKTKRQTNQPPPHELPLFLLVVVIFWI